MDSDKVSRRDEIRANLRKQREKELKAEQTRRAFIIGGISTTAVLAVGAATWGVIASRPEPIDLGEQITPKKADEFGAFHIGSAGEALDDKEPTGETRVDFFIDPQCPACGVVDRAISDRINELLSKGEIDLFITPTAFLNEASTDDYSNRAVNALITVAENAPEYFIDFMNALFEEENQPEEGISYIPVSDSDLAEIAMSVGVPENVSALFSERSYVNWIEQNTEKQLNDRPDLFPDTFATPSIFFGVSYNEDGKSSGHTKVEFTSQDPLAAFDATYEKVQG